MFHWRDNIYFGGLEDGAVRIVRFSTTPNVIWEHKDGISVPLIDPAANAEFRSVEVLLDVRIPAAEWASIVASVSRFSETSATYGRAKSLHDGAES